MKITNISGGDIALEIDLGHKVVNDWFFDEEVVRGITNYKTIQYFLALQELGYVRVEEEKVNWKEEGF